MRSPGHRGPRLNAALDLERPHLRVQRLLLADWLAQAGLRREQLGGLGYGVPLHDDLLAPAGFGTRVLHGLPRVDAWGSDAEVRSGRLGRVRWRDDGHWMLGALEVDESDSATSLETLTQQAYAELFAVLDQAGRPQLLRVWNYLPDIHGDAGGLERYRAFNTGRQRAFLAAGRTVLDGAPAACALGTRGGPLCLRFLAGRTPAVAVENPRQVSAYRYPSDYGPTSPTFSRAALVDAGDGRLLLLISGTASIVGHASLHVGDVRAQVQETLANLRAVIEAARQRSTAPFALDQLACTVYVRRADDLDAVRSTFEAGCGAGSEAVRQAIYLEADICRAELLVEIEAHAIATGEVRA